jgi:hypothetical protein
MTTTEKFSSGVRTCELLLAKKSTENQAENSLNVVIGNSKFNRGEEFENNEGYFFSYRNKKSCSVANKESIYVSCIFAVRDNNISLARELFNK